MDFIDDQRIFFRIPSLDFETLSNIKRHQPSLLKTLQRHFHQTLQRVSDLSTELCRAQFIFQAEQPNQSYSHLRKLRIRMENTEIYEQLFYNVSIIQSFVESRLSKTFELLFEIIEESQIKVIQAAYENLSQFKNLSSLSSRMGNLMRAIFFDIS